MKPGIHPEYRPVLFHDTSADVYFLIGSTAETDKTHTHTDGKTYPYVTLDVSSASHPVYTGEQRKTKSEGRVAGFNKRFAGFVGGKGPDESPRLAETGQAAPSRLPGGEAPWPALRDLQVESALQVRAGPAEAEDQAPLSGDGRSPVRQPWAWRNRPNSSDCDLMPSLPYMCLRWTFTVSAEIASLRAISCSSSR